MKLCTQCRYVHHLGEFPTQGEPCASCVDRDKWESRIITNYDCFISKTPEEIAKIVYSGCPPVEGCLDHDDYESPNCVGCWIDWFAQEAIGNEM